jgi:hypothetical protein
MTPICPQGYHRVTRKGGDSADVNAGTPGGGQTYLWSHEGANKGAPIVAVTVITQDEPVGDRTVR